MGLLISKIWSLFGNEGRWRVNWTTRNHSQLDKIVRLYTSLNGYLNWEQLTFTHLKRKGFLVRTSYQHFSRLWIVDKYNSSRKYLLSVVYMTINDWFLWIISPVHNICSKNRIISYVQLLLRMIYLLQNIN